MSPSAGELLTNPSVSTGNAGKEKGLTAHYFHTPDLAGDPFSVPTDIELSSMWISPGDPLSCRWTGVFTARDSGVYNFGVITEDFARVYIDGKLVIDKDYADLEFMSGRPAVESTGEFDARSEPPIPTTASC